MPSVTSKIHDLAHQLGDFPVRLGAAHLSAGSGAPGAADGGKGSLYVRLDGGANTTLYVREAAGAAVAATGTLTGTTIAAGDTVTIAGVTYTFVAALTTVPAAVPFEVLVGATDSDSLDNLIAAINKAAGEGTTYGTGTTAHPSVTAAAGAGDTMDATAKTAGVAGNSLATTSTLTAGGWGAAYLTGGLADDGSGWAAK